MALTDKRLAFANEYLVDFNGKQAAIRAGFSPSGANRMANKILKQDLEVKQYLTKKMAERQQKVEVTQATVMAELAKIAFLDIRKLYDSNGNLIPVTELDENTAAGVAAVENGETTIIKSNDNETVSTKLVRVRLADKRAALVDLGKHLGMFPNKFDINIKAEVKHTYDLSALTTKELETYYAIRQKIKRITVED